MSLPMPTNCRFDEAKSMFAFQVIWDSIMLNCFITAEAVEKQFPVHKDINEKIAALEASSCIGKKAWNCYKNSGLKSVLLDD
jgi:hypothetical protein